MSTPSHRANLLDPRLNAAGISLFRAGNTLVVVEDLARTVPNSIDPTGLDATEQAVAATLLVQGITQAIVTEAARAACVHPAPPGAVTPVLTIAWDGPTPITLPAVLLAQLPHHPRAELAACPGSATAQGFTTTRITVLLP